jgi:hypothetical protein
LEIVLLSHLLFYCFIKDIPALKDEREFISLVGVSYMKREKIKEFSKEDIVLVSLNKKFTGIYSDDGVVGDSFRKKMSIDGC